MSLLFVEQTPNKGLVHLGAAIMPNELNDETALTYCLQTVMLTASFDYVNVLDAVIVLHDETPTCLQCIAREFRTRTQRTHAT